MHQNLLGLKSSIWLCAELCFTISKGQDIKPILIRVTILIL